MDVARTQTSRQAAVALALLHVAAAVSGWQMARYRSTEMARIVSIDAWATVNST